MKWTALWSLIMTGVMVTGCGTGSGGSSTVSETAADVVPISSAAPGSCPQIEGYFAELLEKTNAARTLAGVPKLKVSLQLGKSAQDYARNMAVNDFFGHGAAGSFETRIRAAGYAGEFVGENLVAGRYVPGGAIANWLASESHYRNLISPAFTEVGFGVFDRTGNSQYGRYWTQHLGSGNSTESVYIPTDCGEITTASVPNVTLQSAVASRSNVPTESEYALDKALPKTAFSETPLSLPGNGVIPVAALAFAVAGEATNGTTEIPEPALLFGLAGLGIALWRDRKVADAKKNNDKSNDEAV